MLVPFVLWVIAIFAALVILMFIPPKYMKPTVFISGAFTVVCGILLYGSGYLYVTHSGAQAAVRTFFSVTVMFIGENSFGDVSSAPVFSYSGAQFLFWLAHLSGIFSTVVAAVSAFGMKALRQLRLKLQRRSELSVIYGSSGEIAAFAQNLAQYTKGNVILVCEHTELLEEDRLQDVGCHLRSDAAALAGSTSFLKSIGLRRGRRCFHLYCLSEDLFDCRNYARKLMASLEALRISPEQSKLTLHASEQLTTTALLATQEHYGYGSVDLLDYPELAARMLMLRFPPYLQIAFHRSGKAVENLNCAIIGFGEVGQAVLRHLVMNGQFEGSSFCCHIFDPNYSGQYGKQKALSPGLFRQYNLQFQAADGCSEQFYDFLEAQGSGLKYIVLCTGNENSNRRIARELREYLNRFNLKAQLCLCDTKCIRSISVDGSTEQYDLLDPALLATNALDQRAMILNHSYCGDTALSPKEEWLRCDYFSRLSSRASADFAEAMAYAAGMDAQDPPENWSPEQDLLENLSKTEHLRWCAFHYAMGFTAMSADEFSARCERFAEEKKTFGAGKIRVGKDLQTRRHACLIPWDALDALSQKENAATGRNVDYKQLDRNNVLALPTLLQTKKG